MVSDFPFRVFVNPPIYSGVPRVPVDDSRLPSFLERQLRDCGGNLQIDGAVWPVFVVEAGDLDGNALAQALLAGAPFAPNSGASEDDRWIVYYVEERDRPLAAHWLDDWRRCVVGDVRPVSPEHRVLIRSLAGSSMPHRVAMQLAELHTRGELPAGCVGERALIRMVLDRAHLSENMMLPALGTLLSHHLVDLVVLLEELQPEDLDLVNDLLRKDPPADPVGLSRREGAAEIHRNLTRFHLISSIDQEKNTAIANPYAAFVDLTVRDGRVIAPVDGAMVRLLREHCLAAIRATRRRLYAGADFQQLTTLDTWVSETLALPFRFLKQRLVARGELAALDWLYIVERAL